MEPVSGLMCFLAQQFIKGTESFTALEQSFGN